MFVGKVIIVPPPPKTQEEIDQIMADVHRAGWEIWNSLPVEERLCINSETEDEQRKAG
jgi:hypothetical protein